MKNIASKLPLALIAIGIIAVLFNATTEAYFTDTEQSTGNTLTITTVWSETLRPNGVGTNTQWIPSAGANYECVNEVTPDNDTSYVSTTGNNNHDSYNLQDHVTGSGTISNVRVYVRAKSLTAGYILRLAVVIGGVEYEGADITLTDAYADYYEDWAQNPATLAAWTWTEIDALEAGFRNRVSGFIEHRVTTVWVVVKYTP